MSGAANTARGPLLFDGIDTPGLASLATCRGRGGYGTVAAVLGSKSPAECIEVVKASGLRGRGGAGFPTGLKWSFVPKGSDRPKYLVCNADESEPGTFKDRELIEKNPHGLIEGMILAAWAIQANTGYVYLRGEFGWLQRLLDAAIAEAYAAGLLGADVAGTGFRFDLHTHLGAGAYICGEETALLSSLEGCRGQPRLKPPFPAVEGLYRCPTIINNVETLANVPFILTNGPEWFAGIGPDKNTGPKLFCVSGHVNAPGVYEASMETTLRQLIYEYAGGIRGGRQLKAVIPGGSSTPVLLPSAIDAPASFDGVAKAGSMLGSAAMIVMDETTCMVWAAENLIHFYRHESCGKCTPCREGSDWMLKILRKIERGEGEMRDLELLESVARNINGKTLCPFGEAEVAPVLSTLHHFRHEYEAHVREGRCPLHADWRRGA